MDFPEIEFTMKPGDKLFLYTDGVNEAQGHDGEQFDFERLVKVLNSLKNETSETVCRNVKEAVDAFVGTDPQFDDMTMMSLTFRGCKRKEDVA
jgi:sigma-B regulation protein RsbU (phosphoserine phosphatase)